MNNFSLKREKKTIVVMINMYCRAHHHNDTQLCNECQVLKDYALQRIAKCHFANDKPTCANCPIHCYKNDMQQQVKKVMRFSGPRMLYTHPILALFHVIDGFKKVTKPGKKKRFLHKHQ